MCNKVVMEKWNGQLNFMNIRWLVAPFEAGFVQKYLQNASEFFRYPMLMPPCRPRLV